jgi:ligand-binding SRPBCC domain-containing protein
MYYELTDRFEVASSPQAVWSFFSNAANLPLITPPWLNFSVATSNPETIECDALLDYTIKWAGIPLRWRTRMIDWSPRRQFIDLQIKGPYTLWHHQHTFEPTAAGVLCSDRVIYKLPLGIIGRMAHALMVRRQLLKIFRYRRKVIAQKLGWVRAVQEDVEITPLSSSRSGNLPVPSAAD